MLSQFPALRASICSITMRRHTAPYGVVKLWPVDSQAQAQAQAHWRQGQGQEQEQGQGSCRHTPEALTPPSWLGLSTNLMHVSILRTSSARKCRLTLSFGTSYSAFYFSVPVLPCPSPSCPALSCPVNSPKHSERLRDAFRGHAASPTNRILAFWMDTP